MTVLKHRPELRRLRLLLGWIQLQRFRSHEGIRRIDPSPNRSNNFSDPIGHNRLGSLHFRLLHRQICDHHPDQISRFHQFWPQFLYDWALLCGDDPRRLCVRFGLWLFGRSLVYLDGAYVRLPIWDEAFGENFGDRDIIGNFHFWDGSFAI